LADKKRPTNEFLARLAEVEAREKASAALVAEYGVTEFELKSCLNAIKDRLLTYNRSLNDAFRRIDGSGNGVISSEEIKTFFRDAYLGDVVNDRTLTCLIDMADLNGDDEIDYTELAGVVECDDILELMALVPDKKAVSKEKQEAARKIGKHGCTVGDLKSAARIIREKLLEKNATVMKALRDVDESGDGVLSRDEVITLLNQYYLIKYTDFYTGEVRGMLDMKQVDTLLDFVDKSGDGNIDYTEFTKVLTSDDIMSDKVVADGTSIFSYKKGAEARHRPEGAWGSNSATGFAASL